jgi:hypothetical protein
MKKINVLRYASLFLLVAGVPVMAHAQSAFDDPGSRAGGTAGGDFRAVTTPITGDVALGASSQIVVLFRNDDNKPVKPGLINLYPSSNVSASIGENQCASVAIQPGEMCPISLQVKGLQQGNYRIEMLMRHDGRSKLLTATINGQVMSTGDNTRNVVSDIEILPTELEFGTITESRAQVRSVTLRNITAEPIEIKEVRVESGAQSGFSVKENCGKLQTGQACAVSVTWSPLQKGQVAGTLVVAHTGATGVVTADLDGTYTPTDSAAAKIFPEAVPGMGLLISSEEEVDFGTNVEQSVSRTVSLVNTGDVPLTLTGLRMANTDNGVRIERRGCMPGTVLGPIEACPLTVTWEPVREGTLFDDVQISHDGARGVLLMPMRGTATKAVNRNSKAIVVGDDYGAEFMRNIKPLSVTDVGGAIDPSIGSGSGKSSSASGQRQADVRGALEGYTITSYSSNRAIVSGPGGSRVVFDKERTVIGGVLWEVKLLQSSVEFTNGKQKVILLFDNSLSSVNLNTSQSVGSGSSSSSAGAASR